MTFTRLLALLALFYFLGFALYAVTLPQPLASRHTDAVVVPTGGKGRIPRGLALLAAGEAKRMLITGADPSVRPGELAAEHRVRPSLFACCIDLGHEAVDTRSNAEETAAWVRAHRYRSVRLVTSEWHMPRARMELRHALDDEVELVGDGVRSNPSLAMLVAEYNKFLVRRFALWFGLGA